MTRDQVLSLLIFLLILGAILAGDMIRRAQKRGPSNNRDYTPEWPAPNGHPAGHGLTPHKYTPPPVPKPPKKKYARISDDVIRSRHWGEQQEAEAHNG